MPIIAITTAAAGAAAASTAAATIARKNHCKGVLQEFDSKAATIAQAQEYADCVHLLYPPDIPVGALMVFILLLGVVCGASYFILKRY